MLIATDRTVYWGDSLGRKPLNKRKMQYLFEVFMNLLANAFPSVSWKRSDENYMIDVLEYEPQRESFSCGFYVYGCNIRFCTERLEYATCQQQRVPLQEDVHFA